jgi:phenylalanyl-tRNA synthetase alpha chain
MSPEMSEALQKLILDTLDLHGLIIDTRAIVLPWNTQNASKGEEQITILGALNSLLSREVNLDRIFLFRVLIVL